MCRNLLPCLYVQRQLQFQGSSLRSHTHLICESFFARSCQLSCCSESVSLTGSSFLCLFLSNSWELENPWIDPGESIKQVQSVVLLCCLVKLHSAAERVNAAFSKVLHICQKCYLHIWHSFWNTQADLISPGFLTYIPQQLMTCTALTFDEATSHQIRGSISQSIFWLSRCNVRLFWRITLMSIAHFVFSITLILMDNTADNTVVLLTSCALIHCRYL